MKYLNRIEGKEREKEGDNIYGIKERKKEQNIKIVKEKEESISEGTILLHPLSLLNST